MCHVHRTHVLPCLDPVDGNFRDLHISTGPRRLLARTFSDLRCQASQIEMPEAQQNNAIDM